MYEYITLKASNERRLDDLVNQWSEEGWEVVGYAIRPYGGVFLFVIGLFTADHFAMLRRAHA